MVCGDTDVGVKRNHNEDNFAIMEDDNLFIVADGMGGHACGEVASQLAIDTLRDFFRSTSADPEATWPYKMDSTRGYEENRLVTGIKLANLRIYESQQRDTKLRGMGTTVAAVSMVDSGVYIGHVGDSRVYRLRDGKLVQLTEDHSLLNDYIKMRRLSEEEIKNFPHKNVIVRALGMKESVRVDAIYDKPRPGDLYLLCTDGLCGPVTDEEIEDLALTHSDLKKLVHALIQRANERGGPDNVTVVATRWIGAG
ncbi:MAG: Stp1/IreP family PP2C-type Ser/Thr phosphatase [Myxococcales bacterium]|nr:Stp1/IreP family PP2C-type Ser/Thr phosphatase [Myxococcales bacterium]MCB9708656.1 Stp1/IreP family PP2C-type Ser/Thr phosphatase [Myxococcales bacterium]